MLAEAKRLLTTGPVVTLTGVGGVGKTRLALRVAAMAERAFADGVWLVELARLTSGELLASIVSKVLGARNQPTHPIDALLDHVADKQLLLVLDNCEHVLQECAALVASLVSNAPGLRILATSREALRVPGEHALTVPPLSVPDVYHLPVSAAAQYEAMTLFADRAQAADPDFTITPRNSATIARLCRRLDGIPLAIELAAAWLPVLSPEEILSHLDDRFQLLTGGWRTAPARHQTMRAAIDWSYELCSPQERTLWARMSIFVSGCDLEAIQEVCCNDQDNGEHNGIAREHAINLIAALVRKSIVSSAHSDGRTRYRMLETIRQYGRERFAHSGQELELRRQHRDYYRTVAAKEAAGWFGPAEAALLARIQQDWPNLRAAVNFCVTEPHHADNAQAALELATDLLRGRAAFFRARLTEAHAWLRRALELNPQPSPARATGLALAAWIALFQGDATGTELEQARELARQIDDDHVHAALAYAEGIAAFARGDRQAISLLAQARDRYRAAHKPGEAHRALMFRAIAAVFLGDQQEALEISSACLHDEQTQQAAWAASWALWTGGLAQWLHGDSHQALDLLQEAMNCWRTQGDRSGLMGGIEALAWLAAEHGQYARAARLLGAARAQRQQFGVRLAILGPWHTAHTRCADTARRQLGSVAYEREYQHGYRLNGEDATRLALNEPNTDHATSPATSAEDLTPREREVAALIAQGMSNKAVAARLVISKRTADSHVDHILTKLGFTNRVQIAAWVAEHQDPTG